MYVFTSMMEDYVVVNSLMIMFSQFVTVHHCNRQTDRQTGDGRTFRIAMAYRLYAARRLSVNVALLMSRVHFYFSYIATS